MPLTLSTTSRLYGFAYQATVQGRAPGGTVALGAGMDGWRLAQSVLSGDGPSPVVLTETVNGTSTDYSFPIASVGVPARTLSISGSTQAASVGSTVVFAPTISGGTAPYGLRALGMLPDGRYVDGLTVAGRYTSAGSYRYVLEVSDANGDTARLAVSVTVADGNVLLSAINGATLTSAIDGSVLLSVRN